MTAFTGTTSERNTTINSRNDRARTTTIRTGSREAILSAKSLNVAVIPPTRAVTPVPCMASGTIVVRSRLTRSPVAESCGEVVG